jgi:hypothetical protein
MGDMADSYNYGNGFDDMFDGMFEEDDFYIRGRSRKIRKEFQSEDPTLWRDKTGVDHVIAEMSSNHLINTIRFLDGSDLKVIQRANLEAALEKLANESKAVEDRVRVPRPRKTSPKGKLFGNDEPKSEYSTKYASHDADGNEIDF